MVKPIPDRFNSISAYLIVNNSVEALEFYAVLFPTTFWSFPREFSSLTSPSY